MKLTRRGLFGLFGGLVASTTIVRTSKAKRSKVAVSHTTGETGSPMWSHAEIDHAFWRQYNQDVVRQLAKSSDLKVLRAMYK